MKVRADIAALIREGHTNAHIAYRLHCCRGTVAEARRVLRLPPADLFSRLYAEAVPTGQVRQLKPPGGRLPLSPAQQAANRAQLLAALRDDAA